MNMNTIIQELHKKIALMDRASFDKFIDSLKHIYTKTHNKDLCFTCKYEGYGCEWPCCCCIDHKIYWEPKEEQHDG